MKKAMLFVLSTLVGLFFVQSANGQYTVPPLEVRMAQGAAYNAALHAANCGGYCSPGPTNPYGGFVGGVGYGYGGGRVSRDISAGLLGAAVGGAFGGRNGAIIGGIAGVGAAELGGHLMARRGGAIAGPAAGGRQGRGFELSNSTRFSVEVYLRNQKGEEKYQGRLASGDTWSVKAPKPGEAYLGYALIPDQRGGLTSDRLVPVPTESGWMFVEPQEAAGRRR